MADDQPTARAKWNVWVFLTLLMTVFLMALTVWGLHLGKLDWSIALSAWSGPTSAGGLAVLLRNTATSSP